MLLTLQEYSLRSDNNIGILGHEPDNMLVDYYLENRRANNNVTTPELDVYTDLEWTNAKNMLTSQAISRFGLKTFPGLGAYGWYHTYYGNRNMVVIPIVNRTVKYAPPTVTCEKADQRLYFTMVQPVQEDEDEEEILYDCFRIVIQQEFAAKEYITYDLTKDVVAPPPGDYEIYVVGYLGVDIISEDSELIELTISSEESFYPDGYDMVDEITEQAIIQAVQTKTFTQSEAAEVWYVNHGLGIYPLCVVVDDNNTVVAATVRYTDENNLTVTFAGAETGKVYMK